MDNTLRRLRRLPADKSTRAKLAAMQARSVYPWRKLKPCIKLSGTIDENGVRETWIAITPQAYTDLECDIYYWNYPIVTTEEDDHGRPWPEELCPVRVFFEGTVHSQAIPFHRAVYGRT